MRPNRPESKKMSSAVLKWRHFEVHRIFFLTWPGDKFIIALGWVSRTEETEASVYAQALAEKEYTWSHPTQIDNPPLVCLIATRFFYGSSKGGGLLIGRAVDF